MTKDEINSIVPGSIITAVNLDKSVAKLIVLQVLKTYIMVKMAHYQGYDYGKHTLYHTFPLSKSELLSYPNYHLYKHILYNNKNTIF